MSTSYSVVSPVDGAILLERPYSTASAVSAALDSAVVAQRGWRNATLAERKALVGKAVDWLVANKDRCAEAITRQIGRPISQSPGEVRGLEERARYMISIAEEGLADVRPAPKEGFERFLRREPLGTVLVLAPWNYPFLTAINTIVPALVAGNTVILKHSSQTPLVAELFQQAFDAAGLPAGVFQTLHLGHADTLKLVAAPQIDFVAFTGSVAGGRAVQQAAASERFIGVGLELGGKDPAYVRADADLASAVENLVDGAFFNSGQSCCGIERIYVHSSLYNAFVDGFVDLTRGYRFGNPLDANTNLGPMVRASAAAFVRKQIADAVSAGAKALIPPGHFAADQEGTAYLAPQVLVNVNHGMSVMRDESFGPVIGIMPVESDEQALALMNDSPYGLTASLWTADRAAALRLGNDIATGTVFMNRCDYLDPALAWTGVKDTGRGVSLSVLGYHQLTRVKSFHLKG
ncbi:aldehyde dehydrogenase family protein [uncultured Aquitalea sp.]|uniref:aldehyde dehydrogenase family protein n=1 Tax=uncultured Aquitalea sp. TaxID=540272 RepID=UPI0025FD5FE6|nr:aldehyde dehydrogenase family protein [uncultured Aquitalea sp.]